MYRDHWETLKLEKKSVDKVFNFINKKINALNKPLANLVKK